MPLDTYTLQRTKDQILSFIRSRGPSLPVHIARDAKLEPLFASAFLSELYREQKLLMSHLKVGSSSLYLIPGQEAMLENFIQFLNQKEQEAFHGLRKEKIILDEQLQPAIRVAMRAIKDFAIPIQVILNNTQKLFWKYAFMPDTEVPELLRKHTSSNSQALVSIPAIEVNKEVEKTEPAPLMHLQESKIEEPLQTEKPKKKTRRTKQEDLVFTTSLREYLSAKDIEILQVIEEKKKELYAKIRINDLFGKQEYYLIAKDRKKVKEEDLTLVLHKAQQERMLALFMAPGELDKKAIEFIKDYRNLVKFERLKF
ncbi:hypothetical protein HYZ97_00320 [Candidatus Pacearchaeota archaeon]|nr:hypothetical protein [Candidatus Pacearchaeota archaeon]